MLNVNYNSATIPVYVLTNYRKYINEKSLIALLHLMSIPDSRKVSWELAAERMGYKSLTPFSNLLNGLASVGHITIDKFCVDATPLWEKCREDWVKPPIVETKDVKPKQLTNRRLAHIMLTDIKNEPGYQKQVTILKGCLDDFPHDFVVNTYDTYNTEIQTDMTPAGWVKYALYRIHNNDFSLPGLVSINRIYNEYREYLNCREYQFADAINQLKIDEVTAKSYIKFLIDFMENSKGMYRRVGHNQITSWYKAWVEKGMPEKYQEKSTSSKFTDAFAS